MSNGIRVACAAVLLAGQAACTAAGGARKVEPTKGTVGPPAILKDPATGMELVFVKGGCYAMGDEFDVGGPDEKPAHEACVDDFYVGKYEVTQAQWKKVMGSNPSAAGCGDACPVENVSWNDAQAFIARLNGASGVGDGAPGPYRLPTEAEWEYAARSGGKHEKYSGGDEPNAVATHAEDGAELRPVGERAPNGLGIHDMSGNVWELTNDFYDEAYYARSPRDNPTGPSSGDRRAIRGGSFRAAQLEVRTTSRTGVRPGDRGVDKGLRLVRARAIPLANASPAPSAAPAPPFEDPVTGMQLVFVKGGCFRMGDIYAERESHAGTDEGEGEVPVHEVCLDDFYIGKYEVTQGQWKSIMGSTQSSRPSGCDGGDLCKADDCPIGNIAWEDVQEFVKRLNERSGGRSYRLPTEAEWEYAARSGGRGERYSGGNDVDAVAWYAENSGSVAHPVGQKAPNGLGIHDMSGNLWEMTSDWYDATYYAHSPRDNPAGPVSGTYHVKRGGCASGSYYNQRASRRSPYDGVACDPNGFRLVKVASPSAKPR